MIILLMSITITLFSESLAASKTERRQGPLGPCPTRDALVAVVLQNAHSELFGFSGGHLQMCGTTREGRQYQRQPNPLALRTLRHKHDDVIVVILAPLGERQPRPFHAYTTLPNSAHSTIADASTLSRLTASS